MVHTDPLSWRLIDQDLDRAWPCYYHMEDLALASGEKARLFLMSWSSCAQHANSVCDAVGTHNEGLLQIQLCLGDRNG